MFVSASTACFPELSLDDALERIADLEFSSIEIEVDESLNQLKPSQVLADLDQAIDRCRNTQRLDLIALGTELSSSGSTYYDEFDAICRLAKATKVVNLTIRSGELGTPFNEEVERLRRLVDIAAAQGARVGVRSEVGRISEDPDTMVVLCDNVKGLGISLDPSHYIFGPHRGKNIEKLMKYVYHVRLRDTSKDQLQVRVGQGEVEYGKLVTQLEKVGYQRSLCVDIAPMPEVDHFAELRKMRLLLESLL